MAKVDFFQQACLNGLAIAEVSPEYRDSMILYIVEDVRQQEIATLLRKHVRTVQRHIKLGLEELRQAYLHLENEQSIDMERESVQ